VSRESVRERIDAIEESYEFFLAFAAQGAKSDADNPAGGQLRDLLAKTSRALDGLADEVRELVAAGDIAPEESGMAMADVLERDAGAARASVDLVHGQKGISSQLVDNLNATIHIRALLTDLFLLDELIPKD
jgi:hypothetical protein